MNRKGLILAGGTGSRLWPLTLGLSKQLLPVYNQPLIYYPLSTLMLAGIREIGVITRPEDQEQFNKFLGDGRQWGIELTYISQPRPSGLADAYLVSESFLDGAPSALILGDNLFYGANLAEVMRGAHEGAMVFGYRVADPRRYGVMAFDQRQKLCRIVEKPVVPPSSYALTGLYFLDESAPERARQLRPSARGELEIVDLLNDYIKDGRLRHQLLGRGYAWLDTGTHASLLDAGNFVRTLTERQGQQVGSPDEIAFRQGWTGRAELLAQARKFASSSYGASLAALLGELPE